ncbi:MAG: hypothetical protein LBI55_00925 [Oscillospiraceae bacterium]|nr:hypothetical protein [Oscillospiraceae bacterium]
MKLVQCPYCKKNLTYVEVCFINSKDNYLCPVCKENSSVVVNKNGRTLSAITLIISCAIVSICFLFLRRGIFWPTILITLIFAAFFILVPFFIELEK